MASSLDGRQLRSGPDAHADLTLNVQEWRGEVWGVMSGAGIHRGYIVGTRSGDTVALGATVLADGGVAQVEQVTGRVSEEADGPLTLTLDWTLGPNRLEASGWASADGYHEVLDERAGRSGTVRLVEVSEDNMTDVVRVRVAPHQSSYVADNALSIAQAHVCTPPGWYRAVYDGDACVGFVMLANFDDPTHRYYPLYHGWYLWRLLIGAPHQRRGYGTQVIRLVCQHIDEQGGPRRLTTSWHDEQGGPEPFYLGLGFEPTGEIDDGEVVGLLTRWPGEVAPAS